jgi:hypothetical protein
MIDTSINRVQVNEVIDNQIPDFIVNDNPEFVDFMRQYYISQEFQGGVIDVAESLQDYKSLDFLNNVNLTKSTNLSSSDLGQYDDVVYVDSTDGWPQRYGLLKIGDEIITYTGITTNSFTGCIRGFSGISEYHKTNDPQSLVFSETLASFHAGLSTVTNLSSLFLQEFFKKTKELFSPGFENRDFNEHVSKSNFIRQVKDFYRTKGTEEAFRILFRVLYNEDASIIKPQDFLFKPSEAKWDKKTVLIARSDNDAGITTSTLIGKSITQSSTGASAPISAFDSIRIPNGPIYYKIFTNEENIEGIFVQNGVTKVTSPVAVGASIITVDSTIGFSTSGSILLNSEQVKYTSKSYNQFFGCSGVTTTSSATEDVFSYDNLTVNDGTTVQSFRLTGVLDKFVNNADAQKKNDTFGIKGFGSHKSEPLFSTWIENIPTRSNVNNVTDLGSNQYRLECNSDHFLLIGDKILVIDTSTRAELEFTVTGNGGPRKTTVLGSSTLDASGTTKYYIRKKIKFAFCSGDNYLNGYTADVQDIYNTPDKVYVATTGLPDYNVTATRRIRTFNNSGVTGISTQIALTNHGFSSGDLVTYAPSVSTAGAAGLETGRSYVVKKINGDNIYLSISAAAARKGQYVSVFGEVDKSTSGARTYTLTPSQLYGKVVQPQHQLKSFPKTPTFAEEKQSITQGDSLGLFVNGVELITPKSDNKVYYGPIQKVNVLNSGSGYGIINPPRLSVTQNGHSGLGASVVPHVSGSISEVRVTTSGTDYLEVPKLTIQGGNGKGFVGDVRLKSIHKKVTFDASSTGGVVNTSTNTFTFNAAHELKNHEQVVYNSQGNTRIGINTEPSTLINNSVYYVIKTDDYSIQLAATLADAQAGTNPIGITTNGIGEHFFETVARRNVVDEIVVVNPGSGYANHQVTAGPLGINTFTNTIKIKDHGYNSSDIVKYSFDGTAISGLTTSTEYFVKFVDKDNIRLSISTDLSTTVNLISVGVGTHRFNHPPITAELRGRQGITTANATVEVLATGSIVGTHVIYNQSGSNWGSLVIDDYYRPEVNILKGQDAVLRPVINNGRITSVNVANGGRNYFSNTVITVSGIGTGAEIVPTVVNGVITAATVAKTGIGYSDLSTTLTASTHGSGAVFLTDLREWTINDFEKNYDYTSSDDLFPIGQRVDGKELPLVSYYAPRELRESVADLSRDANGDEITSTTHSKIIGWAYDGSPIYGPRGFANPDGSGGIKYLESSYTLRTNNRTDGPSTSEFSAGIFLEDYTYTAGSGDLDQYNGRFCVTPEYPNGVYAYFALVDSSVLSDTNDPFYRSRKPVYPYVIGSNLNYYADPDNFTDKLDQNDDITKLDLVKNTYHYKLSDGYEFLQQIDSSKKIARILDLQKGIVNNIEILQPGDDYNVGDKLRFTGGEGGFGAIAVVESVAGNTISTITSTVTNLDNIVLTSNRDEVIAISTSAPHGIKNAEYVKISGVSSATYSGYEGIFRVKVGLTTSGLTTSMDAVGNVEEVTISDSLNIFDIDDIIRIDHEEFRVLNKDIDNNILRLERGYNGTSVAAHDSGSLITRQEKKFTYTKTNLPKTAPPTDSIVFFDPTQSVGLGLTYGVGIGSTVSYMGRGGITTSVIPTRTIRLPGHGFAHGEYVGYSANGGDKIVVSYDGSSTTNMPDDLYIVNVGTDLVGLVTTKAGINSVSDRLFFSTVGVGSTHFFRSRRDVVTTNVRKVDVEVTTVGNHGLQLNDEVQMTVVSSATSSIYPTYSTDTRKVSIGSSVNPPLFVTRGDRLQFISTSSTMNNLSLKFYCDNKFTKNFVGSGSTNIEVKTIAGITTITFSKDVPEELYYRYESTSSTKVVDIDTNIVDYSKIIVLDSKFSGRQGVTTVTDTTFGYNLFDLPERVGYSSDPALRSYKSFSKVTRGPISSIQIKDGGRNYTTLPQVSVASTTGSGASLKAISLKAEHISAVDIFDYGVNYPSDYTLRPYANVPQIVTLTDSYKIDSVGVVTTGKKYLSAPDLAVFNDVTKTKNTSATLAVNMSGSSLSSVTILDGGNNFSSSGNRVIPVNNTNGVGIITGVYTTGSLTLTLTTPIAGFTTDNPLPFAVGDQVFVENAVINPGTGDGYNSEDYDFTYFTLTGVNTAFSKRNQATITYSVPSNPGILTSVNQTATVSNVKDLPTFTLGLKEAEFIPGEIVTNGTVDLTVSSSDSNYVRDIGVDSIVGLSTGDYLYGTTSNSKGTITKLNFNEGYFTVGATKLTANDWTTNTGKTNEFFERVADNDYYQNFSYSVKSKVGISSWGEPVDSLAHITGFEKFSDMMVVSDSLGISSSLTPVAISTDRTVIIADSTAKVYAENSYDLVSENLKNNNTASDEIVFNSTRFGDSVKIIGSRAYTFDDIAPEFFSDVLKYPDAFIEIDRVNTVGIPTNRSIKYHLSIVISGTAGVSTSNTKYAELLVTFDNDNVYNTSYSDLIEDFDIGEFQIEQESNYYSVRFIPDNPFYDYFINDYKETIDGIVGVGSTSYGNTTKLGITSEISAATPSTSHVFGRFSTSDYRSGTSVFAGISTNNIVQVKEVTFLGVGETAFQSVYSDVNSGSLGTCFINMNGTTEILPTFIPTAGLGVTMSVFTTAVGIATTVSSAGISSLPIGDVDLMTDRVNIAASGSPGITSITALVTPHYKSSKNHIEVHNVTDDQYSVFVVTTSANDHGVSVNKYNSVTTDATEPSRDMDNTTVTYSADNKVIINFLPKASKEYVVRVSAIRINKPDDAAINAVVEL